MHVTDVGIEPRTSRRSTTTPPRSLIYSCKCYNMIMEILSGRGDSVLFGRYKREILSSSTKIVGGFCPGGFCPALMVACSRV